MTAESKFKMVAFPCTLAPPAKSTQCFPHSWEAGGSSKDGPDRSGCKKAQAGCPGLVAFVHVQRWLLAAVTNTGLAVVNAKSGSLWTWRFAQSTAQSTDVHDLCDMQGVLLAAAAKTGLAVLDAKTGSVLAALDSAGLVNHGAALSSDGRFFAAATFTADVKVTVRSSAESLRG